MKFSQPIGIISYGTALPTHSILGSEIERARGNVNGKTPESLGVLQKTVAEVDEDTITLSTDAAFQALLRSPEKKDAIGAVFIGSESHPYAVKPSSTVLKEALDLPEEMSSADLQFACKAGTAALQICSSFVASRMQKTCLAIGADTAQSRPGDALEFTAGAGAAAFLIGRQHLLVRLLATCSVMSDTPDFWRRPQAHYPEHAGRFSGDPAYFYHVTTATRNLLEELSLQPSDIDYCVFHTPNAKFPEAVAKQLGFTSQQLSQSLIVKRIGNTYAAASLLGLAHVLDVAEAGKRILVTSYGSGAGSDAFLLETTALLPKSRKKWTEFVDEKIERLTPIEYHQYRECTKSH